MSRRKDGASRRQVAVQATELPQRNNSRQLGDGPDFPELGARNPARNSPREPARSLVRDPARDLSRDSARGLARDSARGPDRDPARNPVRNPARNLARDPRRYPERDQARGRVRNQIRERRPEQDAEPGTRGRIVVLVLASVGGILLLMLNPASKNRIEIVPPLPVTSGKAVTGDPVLTRWGTVQVQIVMRHGRIVQARGVRFPNRNRHGVALNAIAVPALNQEAVTRQSAELDTVTGVTITSQGYEHSLQSAIDRAHLRTGAGQSRT